MSIFEREHPSDEELFDYAERLESGRVPFGSPIAAHVLQCRRCSDEVDTMRASLGMTRAAGALDALEPTDAMQASMLLAMKTHRHEERRHAWRQGVRAGLFAAAFAVTLGAVLRTTPEEPVAQNPQSVSRAGVQAASFSLDGLRTETPEEEVLEPALLSSSWKPENRWERAQREAVEALDNDIEEALTALQHNPALVRAGAVINNNRELKRHKLKTLYAQRSL